MTFILQNSEDPNICRAIEENCYVETAAWAKPPGELHTDQYHKRINTGLPTYKNRVFHTQLSTENADQKITETIEYYRKYNYPWIWIVSPSNTPEDLQQRLVKHGLTKQGSPPMMAVDLDKIKTDYNQPEDLLIKPVDDLDSLKIWARTLIEGFGGSSEVAINEWVELENRIGFHDDTGRFRYLGYLKGRPVATALVVLGGGVAGSCSVATLPEARRRGIGSEMTVMPLLYTWDLGYKVAVLVSSEMGYPVYQKLGFIEYGKMQNYVWRPDQQK